MEFFKYSSLLCVWFLGSFVETAYDGLFSFKDQSEYLPRTPENNDSGDPLFLTRYIEKGEIQKAQQLAKVPPLKKGVHSFSGFLTVNKTTSSNLFFWFFKSQLSNWENQPIVIWLQGGPGSTSLYGLFAENGPFSVSKKYKLKKRKFSWNKKYNLLFIDNPVGVGFSFTKSEDGYARTETDVAENLYTFLIQFLKLFPSLQQSKVYITGESYAGKYIPAIAYKIHKTNTQVTPKINLAGLFIGNGFTDPTNQMQYAKYLYQLGLIDEKSENVLMDREEDTRAAIRAKKFKDAKNSWKSEMNYILANTGLRFLYDFLHDDMEIAGPEIQYINDPKTRKAIHVGNCTFTNFNYKVNFYLLDDFMESVQPLVEELLTSEEFPILFYSGQLDIIVAYPLSINFYNSLKWPHAEEYSHAKRCLFKVGSEVAGYFKSAGTFTEVLVRNTGHMVPKTQPKWAFELLDRFITNNSSFSCT